VVPQLVYHAAPSKCESECRTIAKACEEVRHLHPPRIRTPTAPHCLMPAIIGNTFAASLRTDICPQRKESSSTSHARNPFNLNFFYSAQCLVVLRWRLIGYFPILYHPAFGARSPCGGGTGAVAGAAVNHADNDEHTLGL
jgi:hypothetical protein